MGCRMSFIRDSLSYHNKERREKEIERDGGGGHTLRELAEVTSLKLFKDINTSKEKILGITSPPHPQSLNSTE